MSKTAGMQYGHYHLNWGNEVDETVCECGLKKDCLDFGMKHGRRDIKWVCFPCENSDPDNFFGGEP